MIKFKKKLFDNKILSTFTRYKFIVLLFCIICLIPSVFLILNSVEKNSLKRQDAFTALSDLLPQSNKNDKEIFFIQDKIENSDIKKHKELKDLILALTKAQKGRIEESLNILEQIINKENYSNITKSFASINFVSILLNKNTLLEEEELKIKKYLDFFQNEKQKYFHFATLLKALFHQKINQSDLAKSFAMQLLNNELTPSLIKDQASALLLQN